MVKNYLVDTNILLSNPYSIFGFEDNNIYICGTTLQELDSKKNAPGELGYNAREACRILDALRQKGDLLNGVPLDNGGTFFIEPDGVNQSYLPEGYSISSPDNRIISSCIHLNRNKLRNNNVILLTNDVSMRVNATICGLEVQSVINDHVEDDSYTGVRDEEVSGKIIDEIYKTGAVKPPKTIKNLIENEFVTLHYGTQSALSVHRNGMLLHIEAPEAIGKITPKNSAQTYAMWALSQPDIPLVILEGVAGSAKTFLSLTMGLTQTRIDEQDKDALYSRLMISRPNNNSSDKDFGFLPGDLQDKMGPLLSSFTDNLSIILRGNDRSVPESEVREHIDDMMNQGIIELCPLYSIRGRSIQNGFLICDEAQNASKLLIRDVITRAGKDTKIVLAGDPRQVDNPVLDKKNNGLVYAADKMKGSPLCAIIKFSDNHCVRSDLAEEAIKRMQ